MGWCSSTKKSEHSKVLFSCVFDAWFDVFLRCVGLIWPLASRGQVVQGNERTTLKDFQESFTLVKLVSSMCHLDVFCRCDVSLSLPAHPCCEM